MNRDLLAATVVVAVACAARVAAVIVFVPPLESDFLAYWTMASNGYDGIGIQDPNGQWAYMSAGYPILLIGLFQLFGKSLMVAKVTNIVLGSCAALLVYGTARKLFRSQVAAVAAGLLWATYAEAVVYTSYLAKENLTIFLICLQIYLMVALAASRRPLVLAGGLGAAFGAIAVAGSSGLAIAPAALFALWRHPATLRRRAAALGVFGLCAAVVLGPWLYRNHQVVGAATLTTNAGFNLYVGNNPAATGEFVPITATEMGPGWHQLLDRVGEAEADRVLHQKATNYMMAHPKETARLAWKKVTLFWTPPWHEGKGDDGRGGAERLLRQVWLVQFIALVGLAVFGAATNPLSHAELRPLLLAVLLFTALHALYYVMPRYRLPILGVVAVMAGGGVRTLSASLSHRRGRSL